MGYRLLGRTSCAVSALAPGALTSGSEAGETESFAPLAEFREAGGTLTGTADGCAGTRPEEIAGRCLAARPAARRVMVIATKGRFPTGEPPNGQGLSRRYLAASTGCAAAAAGHWHHRSLPGAFLGPAHADRRDAAFTR